MTALWVALAGSAGALARFALDGAIRSLRPSPLPWATMLINVTGSLLLGFLAGSVIAGTAPLAVYTVVGVGFCGGYTTFSTASFETVQLARGGRAWLGLANTAGTMAMTAGAAAIGLSAGGL
ncbi:Camphor resistance CrcB protein [Segniliparus rotundus DSM 44985]|uniref:Fluoride-specific ion channel FluC n=1 Tax=Segniliparus rotundus (strain ATCC BAA-972 / CDC 1076 / CIP 108378 / DSM 44985 / JCM 13578) TaxID=640132 RepID=D6ZE47_SEGRD|nr:CrcB family protein [Segniliparus rotundus]ADG97327.1 Camphor resistance CrcB protein [Segniliparus rotundus DSM 44985]